MNRGTVLFFLFTDWVFEKLYINNVSLLSFSSLKFGSIAENVFLCIVKFERYNIVDDLLGLMQ